jgi:hypothetical protein
VSNNGLCTKCVTQLRHDNYVSYIAVSIADLLLLRSVCVRLSTLHILNIGNDGLNETLGASNDLAVASRTTGGARAE